MSHLVKTGSFLAILVIFCFTYPLEISPNKNRCLWDYRSDPKVEFACKNITFQNLTKEHNRTDFITYSLGSQRENGKYLQEYIEGKNSIYYIKSLLQYFLPWLILGILFICAMYFHLISYKKGLLCIALFSEKEIQKLSILNLQISLLIKKEKLQLLPLW